MTSSETAIVVAIGLGLLLAAWVAVSFRARHTVRISRWEQGALFADGGFERMLPPGRHFIWRAGARTMVTRISMGPAYLGLGPLEAVTADGMPIRLNATALYRIVDPELALQQSAGEAARIAATQAILDFGARRTLQELLGRTEAMTVIDPEGVGLRAGPVILEDITLAALIMPPELRRAVTEAERARLESTAALERARGEQAALRALANAARLMKDNPELKTLRLLQAVGAAGKGATIMVGEPGATLRP